MVSSLNCYRVVDLEANEQVTCYLFLYYYSFIGIVLLVYISFLMMHLTRQLISFILLIHPTYWSWYILDEF